jgi:hypothetical protein
MVEKLYNIEYVAESSKVIKILEDKMRLLTENYKFKHSGEVYPTVVVKSEDPKKKGNNIELYISGRAPNGGEILLELELKENKKPNALVTKVTECHLEIQIGNNCYYLSRFLDSAE